MVSVLLLAGGLICLYVGAEGLIRGAVGLAHRFGIGTLAIGLTVVAFGTSAPELTVSSVAAFTGSSDIAVGNVVGSNIFNITLILGLGSLIYPIGITETLIRQDIPVMIAVSVLSLLFLLDGRLSRVEGALLLLGIIVYTIWTLRQARGGHTDSLKSPAPTGNLFAAIAFAAAGLLILIIGSKMVVSGSIRIARSLGLSEALIGLTLISAGTSIPELATSVVAALKRQPDIAVGNIVGSNIFNLLAILGTSSLISPCTPEGLSVIDFGVMLGAALLAFPLMWTGFTLNRIEGGILLTVYAAYIAWLCH